MHISVRGMRGCVGLMCYGCRTEGYYRDKGLSLVWGSSHTPHALCSAGANGLEGPKRTVRSPCTARESEQAGMKGPELTSRAGWGHTPLGPPGEVRTNDYWVTGDPHKGASPELFPLTLPVLGTDVIPSIRTAWSHSEVNPLAQGPKVGVLGWGS